MPSLDWIGKASILNHHNEIPYRLVECNEVIGDLNAGNLIVKGDNLHALKALLPYYKGKVKLIYIDPPYNTGNSSWVYNDAMNAPEIKAWLDKTVDVNDLSRSDKWLCMMYPRLKLLKEFLKEDGVIFISIDDAEIGNLRLIMDEIFGKNNFVANIVWQKRTSPDARIHLGPAHDYILVFSKNGSPIFNKLTLSENQASKFKNPDNDPRGLWTSTDFTAQGFRPNQMYKLKTPGGAEYEPPLGRCWANIESVFQNLLADNRMWFGKDGKSRPRVKTYLSETKGISSWTWWTNAEVSHNQEAKKEINAILQHETPFDTPKPTRLIRRILEIATNPDDIVLDSFAGSGTTAHAVLMQNAEDGGSRKFVLVEMEDYAREITAERVKRVIEGYGTVKATGGGFRYCELGEPIKDENGALNPEVSAEALAKHLFFSEYGVPLESKSTLPFIGSFGVSGLYLYFDTLERKKLAQILKDPYSSRVVYASSCTIDPQKLKDAGITFRQLPFEIKDR